MKSKKSSVAASKSAPKKKIQPKPAAAVKDVSAKCRIDASSATFICDVKAGGLEPILGAAYLLTDRAYALLGGDRAAKMTVTLKPKIDGGRAAVKALADEFVEEYATQKVRWAIAKNNLPIREYLAQQAVALANAAPVAAAPAEPAAEELTDDQRSEIEKLIAEVEDEIKTMNAKNAVPDPKGIKPSWEEKQESKAPEAKA